MSDVFEDEVERTGFCNGALILLRRMDSNPEEFMAGDNLLWGDFIHDMYARAHNRWGGKTWFKDDNDYDTDYDTDYDPDYEEVRLVRALTDEEFNTLFEKLKEVEREEFTQQIMKKVFDADKKKKAAARRKK